MTAPMAAIDLVETSDVGNVKNTSENIYQLGSFFILLVRIACNLLLNRGLVFLNMAKQRIKL